MFLRPVTVFGFRAGELFLLVDEKKIKRRFISSAQAFRCIWMRVPVHADPCVGNPEWNAWLMCVSHLWPDPISSPYLFVVRISFGPSHSLVEVFSGLMTTHDWRCSLFYFPDGGKGRSYLTEYGRRPVLSTGTFLWEGGTGRREPV